MVWQHFLFDILSIPQTTHLLSCLTNLTPDAKFAAAISILSQIQMLLCGQISLCCDQIDQITGEIQLQLGGGIKYEKGKNKREREWYSREASKSTHVAFWTKLEHDDMTGGLNSLKTFRKQPHLSTQLISKLILPKFPQIDYTSPYWRCEGLWEGSSAKSLVAKHKSSSRQAKENKSNILRKQILKDIVMTLKIKAKHKRK